MTDVVEEIIEVFLDDRDQIDDAAMSALVEELRTNRRLARQLKEHLLLNELLGQRYGIDRQNFVAQVEQRIRDYQRDESDVDEQVRDLQLIAESELSQWSQREHKARRVRFWLGCAAAVLVAATAWGWFQFSPSRWPVAVVQLVEGEVTRPDVSGRTENVQQGDEVSNGDAFQTSLDQFIDFQYSDGTTLHAGGGSSIRFEVDDVTGSKRVLVHYGNLAAEVCAQRSGQSMFFRTPVAEIEVLGTELLMTVTPTATALHVTEGSVMVKRTTDSRSLWIEKGHCGIVSTSDFALREAAWPTNRSGLVFVYRSAEVPNFVQDPVTAMFRNCTVEPLGLASFDARDAMLLDDGAFRVRGFDDALLDACRSSNELTVEAVIYPSTLEVPVAARIVTFSSGDDSQNFSISQQDDRLLAQIRTTDSRTNQLQPELEVFRLSDELPHHIALTYRAGRVAFYVDGQLEYEHDLLQGSFQNWTKQHLLFGDEFGDVVGDEFRGGHDWSGTLEGVAIYNRCLSEEEVQRNEEMTKHE